MQTIKNRQFNILQHALFDYRSGHIDLNRLIQRIEATSNIIDDENWNLYIFPIVSEMEQINADLILNESQLSNADSIYINDQLEIITNLITKFNK